MVKVSEVVQFELWRQDNNGNRFLIKTFQARSEAESAVAGYKTRGHKQIYDIVEATVPPIRVVQKVRDCPGLFIGDVCSDGCLHLICEVVAYSVDRNLAAPGSEVSVQTDGKSFTVTDNCGKLCRKRALQALRTLNEKQDLSVHLSKLPRLGLKVVTALTSEFVIESSDDQGGWNMRFSRGELVSEESRPPTEQLTVKAVLDPEVFGECRIPSAKLRRTLFEAAHLFPGLKITLNLETFYSKEGLKELAEFDAPDSDFGRFPKPFSHGFGGAELSFTFACLGETDRETRVRSWVNGRPTPSHGSHLEGVRAALTAAGWRPASLMIHVIMDEPEFAGSRQERLNEPKVAPLIQKVLEQALSQWPEDTRSRREKFVDQERLTRAVLKERRSQDFALLREVVNRHDPILLLEAGAPEDEYEAEVASILLSLQDMSLKAILTVVHDVFVRWFDEKTAGPRDDYVDLALEIQQTFRPVTEISSGELPVLEPSHLDPWTESRPTTQRDDSVSPFF